MKSLATAKKSFYNKTSNKDEFNTHNILKLPYSNSLAPFTKIFNNSSNHDIKIVFTYSNTIKNNLTRNNSNHSNINSGVYVIPCKDCNQIYVGESGRDLQTRLNEHKNACRQGNEYSAIANHSLQNDHRIDFKRADVIFKSNCIHKRRIVEGALIRQLNTFTGNKAFTIDDNIIDKLICRNTNLNIHNLQEISPSSVELLANSIPSISNHNNPTHYTLPNDPPPDPPDIFQPNHNSILPRRSARLQNRSNNPDLA